MSFKPQMVGGTDQKRLMARDLAKMAGLSPDGASTVVDSLDLCRSNIERIAFLCNIGINVPRGRELLRKYGYMPSEAVESR